MTAQTVTNYLSNGKQNGVGQAGRSASPGLWQRIQINEWTFSLFLFALSLAIVAGKLYINYGFDKERLKVASERLMNVSREYGDAVADVVTGVSHRYGWLLRAASCGLAMMGFTWFIIYKDSSIPGVNPPLPFSPSKKQYPQESRLQINYLVGVLNGVLIFVYMSL